MMLNLGLVLDTSQLRHLMDIMTPSQLADRSLMLNSHQLKSLRRYLVNNQKDKIKHVLDSQQEVSVQQLFRPDQLKDFEEKLDNSYTKMEDEGPIWHRIKKKRTICNSIVSYNMYRRSRLIIFFVINFVFNFMRIIPLVDRGLEGLHQGGIFTATGGYALQLSVLSMTLYALAVAIVPSEQFRNSVTLYFLIVTVYMTAIFWFCFEYSEANGSSFHELVKTVPYAEEVYVFLLSTLIVSSIVHISLETRHVLNTEMDPQYVIVKDKAIAELRSKTPLPSHVLLDISNKVGRVLSIQDTSPVRLDYVSTSTSETPTRISQPMPGSREPPRIQPPRKAKTTSV